VFWHAKVAGENICDGFVFEPSKTFSATTTYKNHQKHLLLQMS
jgi:hypothetical protein